MDHELVTPCYSEATMPTSKVKTELGFSDVLCSWHSCPCFDAGHNCCPGVRFRLSLHPQGVRSFPQRLLLLISGLERTNPSRRNILWCFIISSPPCLKIWFLSLICSFICLFVPGITVSHRSSKGLTSWRRSSPFPIQNCQVAAYHHCPIR